MCFGEWVLVGCALSFLTCVCVRERVKWLVVRFDSQPLLTVFDHNSANSCQKILPQLQAPVVWPPVGESAQRAALGMTA